MGIEGQAQVRSCVRIDIAPQQGRTRIARPYEGRLQFIEGLSPILVSGEATDLPKAGRLWSS
jgi:hypothetical protein